MVLVQSKDLSVFEMDPAWISIFCNAWAMPLPIPSRAAADELLKYVREQEKKSKHFKKLTTAKRIDAFATGMAATPAPRNPRPESAIDVACDQAFIQSYDNPALLWDIARGARLLNFPSLRNAIFDREFHRLYSSGDYSEAEARDFLTVMM